MCVCVCVSSFRFLIVVCGVWFVCVCDVWSIWFAVQSCRLILLLYVGLLVVSYVMLVVCAEVWGLCRGMLKWYDCFVFWCADLMWWYFVGGLELVLCDVVV